MVDFKKLKKSSGDLTKLSEKLDKLNKPAETASYSDDRFWQPEVDKSGNGYAVIRFLPAAPVDGDDGLPWVSYFHHSFQGPSGSWYIEKSLTTLGQKDPVSEYNTKLWNTGLESDKEIARKQKRKLSYVSNIYVIDDPKHPENNGKVFLFRYGKKIFEKIEETINPKTHDEDGNPIPGEENKEGVNPFDLWTGVNCKLKIRTVDRTASNPNGFRNYDKTEFAVYDGDGKVINKSSLLPDDMELERIWNSEYSLKEFIDTKSFKSYEELSKRFNLVLTGNSDTVEEDHDDSPVDTSDNDGETIENSPVVEETDEDLDYFRKLAV